MKSIVAYILNEDAKDETRINDIVSKSAGNSAKEHQLAFNMAKSITDKSKAMRRYEAAVKLLGDTHAVSVVFASRAAELGNAVKVPTAQVAVAQEPTKRTYTYSESKAEELFEGVFLPIVAKLRGND